MRPAVPLIAAALLTAGCGADRVDVPDTTKPFSTGGVADRVFPEAGLKLRAPADWTFDPGRAPLVASTSSGTATIAVWRYVRSEPLPEDDEDLDAAEEQLQQAVRTRDSSFQLESSERVEVDGAEGIQLLGTETFDGRPRRVRSTHVYAKGAEVVVDTYAAPEDFEAVDATIFRPLVETMKIDPPAS